MNDWISELDQKDRNGETYLVVPTAGIIAPVISIPEDTQIYRDYMAGKSTVNVNRLLHNGVFHHAGTTGAGGIGNMIIAGHSAYYKSSKGRYKTIFKQLPTTDPGEEVWIYQKRGEKYVLYRYRVDVSEEVAIDDDTELSSTAGKKEITLYTCVPIGTDVARWVVKGTLIET